MLCSVSGGRRSRPARVTHALVAGGLLWLAGCTGSAGGDATPTTRLTSHAPTKADSSARSSPHPGVGALSQVPLTTAGGTDAGAAAGRSLNLPAGWTAEVWASVPGARVAAWSPDGRLVVSSGGGGDVVVLTPTTPGSAPTATTLLTGLANPQGVGFTEQNGRSVLVVGEASRIVAWDYSDGRVSNRRVLVDALPTGGHGSKGVAVRGDTVFYSLGSSGNRVPADRTSTPERASIWRVGLDGGDNRMVAVGVRNGFGLAIAPDGTLFSAVNQSDNQPYPFHDGTGYGKEIRSYINENPVDQVSRISEGTDLGWPYCVPDIRGREGDLTDLPFVNDPVFNADGARLDCGSIGATVLGLPAHSAPLGLEFTSGPLRDVLGPGALIASHGSWNRQPPRPPSIAFSPWSPTGSLGSAVDLVTGFQNSDGSRWGRCVTAVPGPDGSIYVTDDAAGLVYRISPGG